MKGYEAVYGYADEVPHYKPGLQLSYPGLTWYWFTYGTPENPNAGKEAVHKLVQEETVWTPRPPLGKPTPSVGLFQQHESSWAR